MIRLTAILLLLVPAGVRADEPPAQPPPAARFDTGRVSFDTGRPGFDTGRSAFDTGKSGFTTGLVGFEQSKVVAPAQASKNELRFELTADVLFDFDEAELRPEADAVLADLAAQVRAAFKKSTVLVEGHTDAKGEEDYNQQLSERRAGAVKAWLVGKAKFSAKAIKTAGFGETRPVAENDHSDGTDDPLGRQKNRRVEIVARAAAR